MSLEAKEAAAKTHEGKGQYGNAAYEYHEAQKETERSGNTQAAEYYMMKFEDAKAKAKKPL